MALRAEYLQTERELQRIKDEIEIQKKVLTTQQEKLSAEKNTLESEIILLKNAKEQAEKEIDSNSQKGIN